MIDKMKGYMYLVSLTPKYTSKKLLKMMIETQSEKETEICPKTKQNENHL
jgi:hypothetical protein